MQQEHKEDGRKSFSLKYGRKGRRAARDFQAENVYERFDKFLERSWRHLTLGIPLERFQHSPVLYRVIVYAYLALTNGLLACYDVIGSIFLTDNNVERIEHLYMSGYILVTNYTWMTLLNAFETFRTELKVQNMGNTLTSPGFAKTALTKTSNKFFIGYKVYAVCVSTSTVAHVGVSLVGMYMEYATTGKIDKMSNMTYSGVPIGLRATILLLMIVSETVNLLGYIAIYVIIGGQAVKIKTMAEIINKALSRAEKADDLRTCIEDHVQLIKLARFTMQICKDINNPAFMTIYLMLAIQMFYLSVVEEKSSFLIAMAVDCLSVLSILVSQCTTATIMTSALASVAEGAYKSPWYNQGKSYSDAIQMIIQMAQQERLQKIWFDSFTVQLGGITQIITQAYSFYTLLLIIKDKN